MTLRLTVKTVSLPTLLQGYAVLRVPPHQRVYGWGEPPVERLLGDCGLRVSGKRSIIFNRPQQPWLFLGTIYLSRHGADDDVDIADGQQRIVTLTILYAVARDLETDPVRRAALIDYIEARSLAPAAHAPNRFRLILKDVDAEFFQTWVQEPGATLRPFVKSGTTASEPVLRPEADDEDDDLLDGLSESQRNIIANRDLIAAQLSGLSDAARGLFLDSLAANSEVVVITAPSIEDARNAYASTYKRGLRQAETDILKSELIGGAGPAVRDSLAQHWDECEAGIGKEAFEDLLEFLVRIHSQSRATYDLQTSLMDTFALPHQVQPFIETVLVPYAGCYRQILEATVDAAGGVFGSVRDRTRLRRINAHLESLLRFGNTEWRASALVTLKSFSGDLASIADTLAGLERMTAVHAIVGVDPSHALEAHAAVSKEILQAGRMPLTSLAISDTLVADARETLLSEKFGTRNRCRTAVLLKLNDLAAGEAVRIKPKSATVEHILPLNPDSKSQWRGAFRHPKSGRFAGARYQNRLGNLTLLSAPDNRKVANKEYPFKRTVLKASTYALSNQAANAKLWNIGAVEARGEALLQQLVKCWNL